MTTPPIAADEPRSATAGGLMGTDYLALAEDRSIADALEQLRRATTLQPEALVMRSR